MPLATFAQSAAKVHRIGFLSSLAASDGQFQIEALRQTKAERSNDAVERALGAVRAAAAAGKNVMPALMDAVKAYATVGEMSNALVEVYGRFQEPTQLWRKVA